MQTILDHMDWTEEEKLKCWRAAESVASAGAKAGQSECNLTFEQFTALISDEGGFDLPARVKDSAAALAAINPDLRAAAPEGHFFDADGELHRQPSSSGQQPATAGGGAAATGATGHGAMAPKVRASLVGGGALPGGSGGGGGSDLARSSYASSAPDSEDSKEGERRPALLARRNGGSPEASAHGGAGDRLRPTRPAYKMQKEPTVPTALPGKSTAGELPEVGGGSQPCAAGRFERRGKPCACPGAYCCALLLSHRLL